MMMIREESSPRSIFIIYWFVSIIMISGIRYIAHWVIYAFPEDLSSKVPVGIFGAGEAGIKLSESIQNSSIYFRCCNYQIPPDFTEESYCKCMVGFCFICIGIWIYIKGGI